MEGGAVRHNFERNASRDHPCKVWFNLEKRGMKLKKNLLL
jgi:hypothetical protein